MGNRYLLVGSSRLLSWASSAELLSNLGGTRRVKLDALDVRRKGNNVQLVSATELLPFQSAPTNLLLTVEADPKTRLRKILHNLKLGVGRLTARVLTKHALSQDMPLISVVGDGEGKGNNPLLRMHIGGLMERGDCQTILEEALAKNAWVPWDGDGGELAEAVCLDCLPHSCALWEARAGGAVRARLAEIFGVSVDNVESNPEDLFACRVSGGRAGEGHTSLAWGGLRLSSSWSLPSSSSSSSSSSYPLNEVTVSARFQRSSSIVTFSIALGDNPTWAVALEEPRLLVRPCSQGGGVVFSGKRRHATLCLSPGVEDTATNASSWRPVVLRGFAHLSCPQLRGDVSLWQWGQPPWNLGTGWVMDRDILDRAWLTDPVHRGTTGGETSPDEIPPPDLLHRVNTTLAHRYYRQGLGGMGAGLVLDDSGRPVVDVSEQRVWIPRRGKGLTLVATLRPRRWWSLRKVIGRVGLNTAAGTSPRMDAALRELFGGSAAARGVRLFRIRVPPIVYVYVDPRYRGLRLGRRLFLEAMSFLGTRGFFFALIVVEDNGDGGLFEFYREMGFVRAEEQVGIPNAMIAPIPPPKEVMDR
ncbi:unnamed protein product [Discosporangium mesarthrocarpum]